MIESFLDRPEMWLSAEDWSKAVQELKKTDYQRRRTKEVLEYSLKKVEELKEKT
jgi:hypothetical protein|tara:strand:+ start:1108 stop:1269 length:162 start_codon:yes stop_codon:yes gene_type:complete